MTLRPGCQSGGYSVGGLGDFIHDAMALPEPAEGIGIVGLGGPRSLAFFPLDAWPHKRFFRLLI